MRKLKIYLETTVFNWYFEPERGFTGDIQLLFDEIADGNSKPMFPITSLRNC